jgi:Mn2+/Fe2+ NRAMP family transporter
MRNTPDGSTIGRVVAGFVMGSLTLALIGLTAVLGPTGVAAVVHPPVQLIFPLAATAAVLIAALSSSARIVWGRLCLMNGVVSLALACASVQNGQPLWPTDPVYERALDQAMQWWLRHVIWTTAAYFAAAIIIAAVLFALSYWLMHSPHERHREAH